MSTPNPATRTTTTQYIHDKDAQKCGVYIGRPFACLMAILLTLGGAAMTAIGVSHFTSHLKREALVQEYNAAVSDYQDNQMWYMRDHRITATASQSGLSYAPVNMSWASTPVVATPMLWTSQIESDYLSVQLNPWHPADSLTVNMAPAEGYSGNSVSTTRYPNLTKEITASISCNRQSCTEDCEYWFECPASALTRTCQTLYGADATYTGSDECHKDEECGMCRYTGYLNTVCVVLDTPSSTSWINGHASHGMNFDHTIQSCFFPFGPTDHIYTHQVPAQQANGALSMTVNVQLRSQHDPFITMQRLTEGTMDFGGFAEENYRAGALFVVFGVLMILTSICGVCCYACCCRNKDHHSRKVVTVEDGLDAPRPQQMDSIQQQQQPLRPQPVVQANPIGAAIPVQEQQERPLPQPQPQLRHQVMPHVPGAVQSAPVEGILYAPQARHENEPLHHVRANDSSDDAFPEPVKFQ